MRLTASGLDRTEKCVGSAVLPAFAESSEWSGIGNAADAFVQTEKKEGREKALAEAPAEHRDFLAALDLAAIPDGAEFQVAFAYNALTGDVSRIPSRAEGYPDLGDEWILGTSDIIGVRDGRVLVWDLKVGIYSDGRDPATDLQLGLYSVSACAIAGVDEAEVCFLRAGWDGVMRPESATLDAMDLAAMRDRIGAIWRRARAASYALAGGAAAEGDRAPQPVPLHVGEWCGYCPARLGCDAIAGPTALMLRGDLAALAAAPAAELATIREKVQALTPEQRGRAYELAGEIEDRAKAVRAAIRADAKLAPIPIGDGSKELREVQWGQRQASPVAKAREEALEKELREQGEVKTIKLPMVRVCAVKRGGAA